jgi:hypothetical protein
MIPALDGTLTHRVIIGAAIHVGEGELRKPC